MKLPKIDAVILDGPTLKAVFALIEDTRKLCIEGYVDDLVLKVLTGRIEQLRDTKYTAIHNGQCYVRNNIKLRSSTRANT